MRGDAFQGRMELGLRPGICEADDPDEGEGQAGPEVVTGEEVKSDDPVLSFLPGLSTQKGWHRRDGMAIQVVLTAPRATDGPKPRFDPRDFPLRTTYRLFHDAFGRGVWRILERDQPYSCFPKSLDREARRAHHDVQVRKRKVRPM